MTYVAMVIVPPTRCQFHIYGDQVVRVSLLNEVESKSNWLVKYASITLDKLPLNQVINTPALLRVYLLGE